MEKFWQNGYNPVLREAVETQRGDINYFLPLIYTWVKNHAQNVPKLTVVELGVRGGESTVALASAVMEINVTWLCAVGGLDAETFNLLPKLNSSTNAQ